MDDKTVVGWLGLFMVVWREVARPKTYGQRSEVGRYIQGVGEMQVKRCNACLKTDHKQFSRECAVIRGDTLVPCHRKVPALTPDEHYWTSEWRSMQSEFGLSVRDVGGGGRGQNFERRGH